MMNHTMYSRLLLSVLLVAFGSSQLRAEEGSGSSSGEKGLKGVSNKPSLLQTTCCSNQLELDRLCVNKVKANCIDSNTLTSRKICADQLRAATLCVNEINDLDTFCASAIDAVEANVMTLNANDICVSGVLQANTLVQCQAFRATAVFSVDTTYALGTPVNFDAITDDPNGDMSLLPFTHYTAPVSGYYIVTLQTDIFDLAPTSPSTVILGSPISRPAVMVNGSVFREANIPFLTFSDSQAATISALISLKAGDIVSAIYQVFTVDATLGLQSVSGTVKMDGNGLEDNRSMFKIHYLSSSCEPNPCPTVTVCNTASCDFSCEPCC